MLNVLRRKKIFRRFDQTPRLKILWIHLIHGG